MVRDPMTHNDYLLGIISEALAAHEGTLDSCALVWGGTHRYVAIMHELVIEHAEDNGEDITLRDADRIYNLIAGEQR